MLHNTALYKMLGKGNGRIQPCGFLLQPRTEEAAFWESVVGCTAQWEKTNPGNSLLKNLVTTVHFKKYAPFSCLQDCAQGVGVYGHAPSPDPTHDSLQPDSHPPGQGCPRASLSWARRAGPHGFAKETAQPWQVGTVFKPLS